jgi:hypothetical protein
VGDGTRHPWHGLDLSDVERLLGTSAAGLEREATVAWRIEQKGFDPAREHAVESIFTVGNGYLRVRGTLDSPLPGSQGGGR